MINDILRLLYDYSINNRLVDNQYIDKILEIVVRDRQLDDYVNNVLYTSNLSREDGSITCAVYNPFNKNIKIDYESVRQVLENRSIYDCLFHNIEQIMFKNLIITQILLHELEHAMQFKKGDNKADKSLERKLIKASLILDFALKNPKFIHEVITNNISIQTLSTYMDNNRELYQKYYQFDPTERLAEINSFQTIIKVLEQIKKNVPNLYEFKEASYGESLIRGYCESWQEGICPTQVYLFGVRQSSLWFGLSFFDTDYNQLLQNVTSEYNLNQRLSLGLPVLNEEYENVVNWLNTTNKFNT